MSTPRSSLEDTWCRHLPQLHRGLADPGCWDQLPEFSADFDLNQACAYWETLHYLFHALLGWRDIGAGLARWYAAGRPSADDPLMDLVEKRWNSESQLDYYAAWHWSGGLEPDYKTISPAELGTTSRWHNEDWWRALKRRGRPYQHDPVYGGSNPLHLGHSEESGEQTSDSAALGFHDPAARRAVLVVSQFNSWRRDLREFGRSLPALGDRSWHVEVFDRAVGFLGLYRQSRTTGLWFQGRHSLHMAGNRPKAPHEP